MILSDSSIRAALAEGRIEIDPLDESCIQPSSVDLHLDRYFRVFLNHTTRVIDVKDDQENLTELIKVEADEEPFILHPGEFVLGSTSERVKLAHDLVGRLDGKSSLGRLGLLIHSSLPASERVAILVEGALRLLPIGQIVEKQLQGSVVSFDPESFEVSYHEITGWFEGPADRIFEITLASGRSVRVTAGHNLFTLDRSGKIAKTRTAELRAGVRVAIARQIPAPPRPEALVDVLALVPESAYAGFVLAGPAAERALRDESVAALFKEAGYKHVDYYRSRSRLPLSVAMQLPHVIAGLGPDDRLMVKGSLRGLPPVIRVDRDLAWLFGLYVAEGSRRRNQVTIANTDDAILDRAEAALSALEVDSYRASGRSITAMSGMFSHLIDWLDAGTYAHLKRVPSVVFSWPTDLIDAFLEGFVDGDGSTEATRRSLWSSSERLVDDFLYLLTRLGHHASASFRRRSGRGLFQVSVPYREHKLLTAVPLPDRLLVELRNELGLTQAAASAALGYKHTSDLNNIERRSGRDAVRRRTLRRMQSAYCDAPSVGRLDRLVDGDLLWDTVVDVRDTGQAEPIYDLEVRPGGRHIENFLAGTGGVFVSNTAGFVDPGFDGYLTLELANVANLPITLYPGMKIGQISFLMMTTAAENPYGSKNVGSKYQGQRGPTPSRYFENFR